ncbi:MAG: glycosyltransferase family 9 protein, partial [Desulfobacteraceae bacterium]|nr:glycosyltransferase family 9 protein [Desulfobacteraceae bacterium]
NRWTVEGFSELADAVWNSYGIQSVLTGGPEDTAMARAIARRAENEPHNLVGKTSIDELTAVINRAQLVVSCDTGPMHLAVALGRPVVALFGPSNPRRTGPFYGEVVRKNMPCVPCNRSRCKSPLCMHEISCRDVMERIAKIQPGQAIEAESPPLRRNQ